MEYKIIKDSKTGVTIIKTLHRICPQCQSEEDTRYDDIHDELYCYHCGLVLEAPPYYGLDAPGLMLIVKSRSCPDLDYGEAKKLVSSVGFEIGLLEVDKQK